jgi:transglutaminase-like putative cysteine protease
LVSEVRAMNPPTREQTVLAILAVMKQHLTFNMAYFASGTPIYMPASQSVRLKTGVCFHYSNVFVSTARALGIPARGVYGLLLNGTLQEVRTTVGLGKIPGHTWAEVSLDDQTWTPLDPQYPGRLNLPSRAYLPLIDDKQVLINIEEPGGTPTEHSLIVEQIIISLTKVR